ncbi:MAG TPA: GNAT family N-acetyltransferase [Cryomorphaceae bacterium]|nr:GNAT family N-acetyltransferase [Cryomorphaceae bacterium]
MTSSNVEITCYNSVDSPTMLEENAVIDFLFNHLDEYGDPKEHIRKAIEYACSSHLGRGGFVLSAKLKDKIVGAVVVNQTGMEGYIPENILVYIAVDGTVRGKGIGRALMNKALEFAHGDVALHVEPENPAKILYEKLGFTNKYLEMRYSRKKD